MSNLSGRRCALISAAANAAALASFGGSTCYAAKAAKAKARKSGGRKSVGLGAGRGDFVSAPNGNEVDWGATSSAGSTSAGSSRSGSSSSLGGSSSASSPRSSSFLSDAQAAGPSAAEVFSSAADVDSGFPYWEIMPPGAAAPPTTGAGAGASGFFPAVVEQWWHSRPFQMQTIGDFDFSAWRETTAGQKAVARRKRRMASQLRANVVRRLQDGDWQRFAPTWPLRFLPGLDGDAEIAHICTFFAGHVILEQGGGRSGFDNCRETLEREQQLDVSLRGVIRYMTEGPVLATDLEARVAGAVLGFHADVFRLTERGRTKLGALRTTLWESVLEAPAAIHPQTNAAARFSNYFERDVAHDDHDHMHLKQLVAEAHSPQGPTQDPAQERIATYRLLRDPAVDGGYSALRPRRFAPAPSYWEVWDVPGDGSCFFHALIDQLLHNRLIPVEVLSDALKALAVAHHGGGDAPIENERAALLAQARVLREAVVEEMKRYWDGHEFWQLRLLPYADEGEVDAICNHFYPTSTAIGGAARDGDMEDANKECKERLKSGERQLSKEEFVMYMAFDKSFATHFEAQVAADILNLRLDIWRLKPDGRAELDRQRSDGRELLELHTDWDGRETFFERSQPLDGKFLHETFRQDPNLQARGRELAGEGDELPVAFLVHTGTTTCRCGTRACEGGPDWNETFKMKADLRSTECLPIRGR